MARLRTGIAVVLAAALLTAACGGGGKSSSSSSSSGGGGSSSSAQLTASFRGITATEIKIGVAVVDFKCIEQFVDSTQGDDEKTINAMVSAFNKAGGIDGRQIKIVFKKLCPLQPQDTAAACTSFTDDEQVFAVIGVYDTPPSDGSNQLCIAKDKETVLIDELATQKTIEGSKQGLLLMPGILPERRLVALLNLLKQKDTLKGKTVALLADQNNQDTATKAVKSFTDAAGLKTGDTAVLTITNDDTTAAQAQLDSFIEKWKQQGVNALIMAGQLVSAKQFVEKIKGAIPDMQLVVDTTDVSSQAQDEKRAGKSPNPYEGTLTLGGLTDQQTFETPGVQACVKMYEDETGEKVIAPKDIKPGADGKKVQVFIAVQDRCNELTIIKLILEKAGPNPTNDSWIAAVNSIGKVQIPTQSIASFGQGKYDAADGFALAAWDSSLPPDGDFKTEGEPADVTK